MEQKLQFLLLIHNHQPLGNFDYVFENAYQKSYKPFLDVFKNYDLKMSLHLSGPLFDWLLEHHIEYLEEIKRLVKSNNIEIIGSGYYEPILAAIPIKDAIDQIKIYKNRLESFFETTVRGSWLTERVWEPHLPQIFRSSGIEYISIDDFHFIRSGLSYDQLDGYYLTDFENYTLAVYPGSEKLRYIMPFSTIENVSEYFYQLHEKRIKTIIFADDGEKFGIWPETYKWVYEEKWLEKFFDFLENNKSWIETKLFYEHFDNNPPNGLCYFPTTSYPELGEWALPAESSYKYKKIYDWLKSTNNFDEIKPFFQGGQWKNFLSKYKESLVISKKMYLLSKLSEEKSPEEKLELYKSQCNDSYWHGVFGGLYLPHLRREIQTFLSKGYQKILPNPFINCSDFDMDGERECFIYNKTFSALFDADDGGGLISLDFNPRSLNITDTLTRRKEAYHLRIAETQKSSEGTKTIHDLFLSKEENLERFLHYDRFYRSSGRIYLFDEVSLETLYQHKFNIHPITTNPYELSAVEEKNVIIVEMNSQANTFTVSKRFIFDNNNIKLKIKGSTEKKYNFVGLEWNFNLFAPNAPDRYIKINGTKHPLNIMSDFHIIEGISIVDEWYGINIDFKEIDFEKVFIYPVETISLSESGMERTFQGTCLVFVSKIESDFFDKHFSIKVDIIEK
ncbi:MAG: DUF1926 domain-containing protein [Proteobacteria bacterium]|nr:DUF1926 domain-containing protein [Pseudomonadota bacterium]